ncbi:hypothetical protein GIB67_040422 [Kingdonia uniflora]|uniref:Leucine-rich repeat receptor-like serine/threonine-protein kinase n=1 Tax=Kingdonia uniflora TaxID=39325 RepID=A0A7J7KXL1_9MAGN|nr:hypothetical protein GIB67_040422 [Kingdonia uniflora]
MSLMAVVFIVVFLVSKANSQFLPPKGLLINCGASESTIIDGRRWLPDTNFISRGFGTPKSLAIPDLFPTLITLRSFPLRESETPRRFCYEVPVFRHGKYLVRTSYYYGGINGAGVSPPVFDQIVDGTIWTVVNTTEDYNLGLSSYYEGFFVAAGRTMSVCVATNVYTDSDPYISSLEFVILGDSVYNSTDFGKNGLSLVARSSFGYGGPIIKFPDDPFDRYWEPFLDSNPVIESIRNVSVSSFWNLPPSKVFYNELTTNEVKSIELQWPQVSLPNTSYYIALYFADNRGPSSGKFNIIINGIEYYHHLNATSDGVVVFTSRWPLLGLTNITLAPSALSEVGPLINAGEIFKILLLGGRTATRDVIALERLRKSLQNPPIDWNGDPCLPRQYTWSGVTCSEGPRIRVITLNMSSMGLSGSISPGIAKLTALTDIWLANNSLSGIIPDLRSLSKLETLHLEGNQFNGNLSPSLGSIGSLREL